MKGKIKLMTWNMQNTKIGFPRGCRFAEILRSIEKSSTKIAFFSEISNREHGIMWIISKKLFGVVIYGRKIATFLWMIGQKIGKSKGATDGYQIEL